MRRELAAIVILETSSHLALAARTEGSTTAANGEPGPSSPDPTQEDANQSGGSVPYWSQGSPRVFIAGRAVPGLGSGRLALATGYGKPHWFWAGMETAGYLSPFFGSFQGGFRASAILIDISFSLRHTASFEYGLVAPVPSVGDNELGRNKNKAAYNSLDASLWGFVPYGTLLVSWEFTYTRPFTIGDSLLYEEMQRVVVGKQGLFTTKLIPMVRILPKRLIYVGLLGEQLSLLGRTNKMVLRIGPSMWARIGDHWDLFACFSWPVQSPDQLGFLNGTFGYLGVTYAFASGENEVASQ